MLAPSSSNTGAGMPVWSHAARRRLGVGQVGTSAQLVGVRTATLASVAMDSHRFDATVYARRLAAAAAATADAGLAGLVITPGYDLRYLVGSRAQTLERFTALVLPASGEPTIVVPRLELASLQGSAVAELGLAVQDWVDGDDPYQLVGAALGGAPAATAVTDSMPALHLLPLAGVLGVQPVLATDVLRHAADGQGGMRDRRAAQGRCRHRSSARPGAGVFGPGPDRGRRGRRHRRSDCRRRAFGGGVHHRGFRTARRRPAPRVFGSGITGRGTSSSSTSAVHTSRDTIPTRRAPTAWANPNPMWRISIRCCSGLNARPLTRSAPV